MFWYHHGISNRTREETYFGVTEKTSQTGLGHIIILKCRKKGVGKIILKCSECGNTFKRDGIKDGEILACTICESDYRILVKDGKVLLKSYVYETEDLGEL